MAAFWIRSSIPAGPSSSSRSSNRNPINRHCDLENDLIPNHPLNTNEKTPLLRRQDVHSYGASESTSLLSPPPPQPDPEQNIKSIPRDLHRLRIRKLLLALICITLFTPLYTIAKCISPGWPWPSPNPRPPSVPWRYYSRQYMYGLTPNTTLSSYTLSVHEFINPDLFPLGVTGSVKLLTGKPTQSHNLLVYIQVYSNFASPINCIQPNRIITPGKTENITITSIPNKHPVNRKPTEFHDFQTFVNVWIYTRPEARKLGHVSISTNLLDIEIPESGAKLETEKLSLSSVYKSISNLFPVSTHGNEVDPLSADHISLYSRFNNIIGNWGYGLSYSATALEGNVDVRLYPKLISWGKYTPADINIVAKYHIFILTPWFKDQLSLRNTSISMLSYKGDINAQLVTGSFTNLTALDGNIWSNMLPYWGIIADGISPRTNTPKINTYSKFNSTLSIDRPVDVGGLGDNPFEIMVGKHVAEEGSITVRYPDGFWKGRVDVQSLWGRAEILGVDRKERDGVVREADGKVYLKGQNLVSFTNVVGGKRAVFKFWKGSPARFFHRDHF
ncbi:hypothetical protein TWF225_005048 [Orbilia oligospora]|nr:hypothetical protein TWF225_005048 [Orbilia oligospora]KAF3251497.1 hypothetical protein TWF128_007173 [Orbilia oligospora]KAF3256808.1 hypothetical protein TWF217_006130 [Orbilia oligospora]